VGTASILVPTVDPHHVTTQTEGFQALMWHLLVGHPSLAGATPKWESVAL
jgi:D-sedoheptulose 7-phosphate isomerase